MSWKVLANKKYNSKEDVIKLYQKVRDKNDKFAEKEQDWVDSNLMPLIDFMGDEDTWTFVIPDIKLLGLQGRASSRKVAVTNVPVAVYSGAHWTARKANSKEFFDPYDHYQIQGTNQFCQTFAMMYLEDVLPLPLSDDWKRNYTYAVVALEFIKSVIQSIDKSNIVFNKLDENGNPVPSKKQLLVCLKNCLKYPNICVNAIEYPR